MTLGDAVYFESCDEVPTCQLWRTNGTPEGTFAVTRFSRSGARVAHLTEWNGALYFEACDARHGCELRASDGTAAGTELVADVAPGPADAGIVNLTAAAGRLFFTTANSHELWTSDGTAAGTRRLRNLWPAVVTSPVLGSETRAFFVTNHLDLWVTDGTVAGTRLIADRRFGTDLLATFGGKLFFSSTSPTFDRQLWTSDGTAAGTRVVRGGFNSQLFPAVVFWTNQHAGGVRGSGRAIPGTDETGYFWFFDRDNVELAVKVLDGRAVNGKFWVFYGALTDVEYRITVSDTETGASRTYHKPPGEICGRGDTAALEP